MLSAALNDNSSYNRRTFRQGYVSCWLFYDTEGWPGWIVYTITTYYIGISVVTLLDGVDIPFIGFAEELTNQVETLNLTIRNIIKRAR